MNRPVLRLDQIPRAVLRLLRTLAQAGERGWIVGGALRDRLLGRSDEPDWDIATTALPERVMELFHKVVPTGIAHGTVTVLLDGHSFEVTTLRGETTYSDGRHPDAVQFVGSIEADLERRDFTVNAMAFDPLTGEFFDPFGGLEDLASMILRAVGDPRQRFAEDGLRLLRAARLGATLEMSIEAQTEQAMSEESATLDRVSAERKRDELRKMLRAVRPSVGFETLQRTSLWPRVFRDHFRLCKNPPSEQRWLARMDIVGPKETSRLAALLADCPLSNATRQDGETARQWLTAMRFDRSLTATVSGLVERLALSPPAHSDSIEVRRFAVNIGQEHLAETLAIRRAEALAVDNDTTALDDLGRAIQLEIERGLPLSLSQLAVSGTDLMTELGLPAGPQIGQCLRRLHLAVIEGRTANERACLLSACAASLAQGD